MTRSWTRRFRTARSVSCWASRRPDRRWAAGGRRRAAAEKWAGPLRRPGRPTVGAPSFVRSPLAISGSCGRSAARLSLGGSVPRLIAAYTGGRRAPGVFVVVAMPRGAVGAAHRGVEARRCRTTSGRDRRRDPTRGRRRAARRCRLGRRSRRPCERRRDRRVRPRQRFRPAQSAQPAGGRAAQRGWARHAVVRPPDRRGGARRLEERPAALRHRPARRPRDRRAGLVARRTWSPDRAGRLLRCQDRRGRCADRRRRAARGRARGGLAWRAARSGAGRPAGRGARADAVDRGRRRRAGHRDESRRAGGHAGRDEAGDRAGREASVRGARQARAGRRPGPRVVPATPEQRGSVNGEFYDRRDAGRRLAERLSAELEGDDVIVLGLPRGGVPVAAEVAEALGAPLEVFLVRKLGVPGHEELAMGAIASGGVRVLNEDVVGALGIGDEDIERVAGRELTELERRERAYREGRAAAELGGRTGVLVDDGLATGASMRAAVLAVRRSGAKRVIVAVPVAPRAACAALQNEA